ncbi:MAG: hypothetical protein AAF533_17800 [Acidobacteriota bacterium]
MIASIVPDEDHRLVLAEQGVLFEERDCTTVVTFDEVVEWDWLAARTKDKRRDGNRLVIRLRSGDEVIVTAPGWSWQTTYHLFRQVLPDKMP